MANCFFVLFKSNFCNLTAVKRMGKMQSQNNLPQNNLPKHSFGKCSIGKQKCGVKFGKNGG